MATITVRRLVDGDPSYGSGFGDLISDRDAVAQIIGMRLKFLQGEWWEDLTAGFPLFQSILNSSGSQQNQQAVLLLIQQEILAVPYVTSVTDAVIAFDGKTRKLTFSCTVQTQFGTLTVTNTPGTAAVIS